MCRPRLRWQLILVDLTGTGAQDAAIGQVAWDKMGANSSKNADPVRAQTSFIDSGFTTKAEYEAWLRG